MWTLAIDGAAAVFVLGMILGAMSIFVDDGVCGLALLGALGAPLAVPGGPLYAA